ncbi:UNVERIFIED_CONTAM: hypothetical protein K2H54_055570 [Gekko kuhli]
MSVATNFRKDMALASLAIGRSNMGSPESIESPLSKKDILHLKEDLQNFFKASMAELLQPVQAKLDDLTEGLGAAGCAVELALEAAEDLQVEDNQKGTHYLGCQRRPKLY